MLTSIRLENFRRFEDHEVQLGPLTILVGPNNAGKSTIVEGLRLLALVTNRLTGLQFERTPDWIDAPAGLWCVVPSLRNTDIELDQYAFHGLGQPPAIITGRFDSGVQVQVFIGPSGAVCGVVRDKAKQAVVNKREARALRVSRLEVQPQVAPLLRAEEIRDTEYVRGALDSGLAPRHFRNQLWQLRERYFEPFRSTAERGWAKLRIEPPELRDGGVHLLVRTEDFTGEVGRMGHGFQMWLQLMWFLTRVEGAPTVILDEPDVYMHADLQRRLIKTLRGRHEQTIIATHSAEIISDVEASEIVVVNARATKSKRAASPKQVQAVIGALGGSHNLPLTRLWNSRRCLFVEGRDVALLKRFNEVLQPGDDALDTSPVLDIEGWDGWAHIPKLTEFVRKTVGDDVRQYCLLDSDYHWPEEIEERYAEADSYGVELLILSRKEIENYVLVAPAVWRCITKHAREGRPPPTEQEVVAELARIGDSLRESVAGKYTDSYQRLHPRVAPSTALARAGKHLGKLEATQEMIEIAGGKKHVLARVAQWSQDSFGVSLSADLLASSLSVGEIAPELKAFLDAFRAGRPLPTRS